MSWIGGLISGVGSLFGAGIGALGQQSANEANLEAVEKTNQANKEINQANINAAMEMYNRQEQYNRSVYEDQKLYNSAKEQRERLEEAGLNPYMMMDGGSAGSAGSSSAPSYSQPGQIPMQAGHVESLVKSSDMVGIAESINRGRLADAEIDKTNAEASSQWQDANYRRTMLALSAAKMVSEMKNIDAKTKGQLIDNFVNQNTSDYTIQRSKNDAEYSYHQARSMALEVAAKKANLPYIAPTAQATLDSIALGNLLTKSNIKLTNQQVVTERNRVGLMAAQVRNLILSGELSKQQAAKAYQEAIKVQRERLNMPKLNDQQVKDLSEAMVESAVNASTVSGMDADKAAHYLDSNDSYRKALNFFEQAGKAILPFK